MDVVGLTVLIVGGLVAGVSGISIGFNCIKENKDIHAIIDTIFE